MKALLILFIVLLVMAGAVYTVPEGIHNFSEKDCYRCHRDPYGNPKALVGIPITELCKPCHMKTVRASSHPVDIEPSSAKVPPDLPLRGGKLTCSTCHNIHGENKTVFGLKSYFLRRPTSEPKFFCLSCHEEKRLNPGHRDLMPVAHMGSRYRVTASSEPIDSLSQACIGCHDGEIAVSADVNIGGGLWRHLLSGSHPIGIHYGKAIFRNRGLAPVADLDRRIRFFGGKIGCGTCHDMYSMLEARLIMENTESRLCRQCHYDK